MTTLQPLITARGLHKTFRGAAGIEVLRGIDITIKPMDRIAIVGKSGAGKSTLLHLLGTLERPTRGELYFGGEDVLKFPEKKLALYRNRHIGFVFQFHYLMLEFTALENVMIPMLIGGEKRSVAQGRAQELLEAVGLGGRLTHKPNQLSGGEQQRVAIARAIAQKPKVLLTDEMTGNLDGETGQKILELVDALQKENSMAVISVTHDEELARRSKMQFTLENGTLVAKTPF